MRIAVMGAGGVGGFLGGMLAKAGNDVSLIARGAQLDAVRKRGLRFKRWSGASEGSQEFTVTIPATDDPSEVGPVDLVLYTVKAYQNQQAVTAIRPLLGPKTGVLTLQNGVESHHLLGAAYGPDHVLPGAYWGSAYVVQPGFLAEDLPSRVTFGEATSRTSDRAESIDRAFRDAGIESGLAADAESVVWSKFVPLAAVAGATSASRTRIKQLLGHPEGYELFYAAVSEGEAVGRAKGVNLPDDLVQGVKSFLENAADFQNSMHLDVENGRPTELDALSGAVVRLGQETGVPTPIHSFLYALLLPLKDGAPLDSESGPGG